MEEEQTIAEVARLLARYPGVTVDFTRPMSGAIRVVFQVAEPESLARLVRCADGANVPAHVWMRGPSRLDAPRADPAHLRYEFRVPDAPSTAELPSALEILGIRLVWDAVAYGVIDQNEANRLLDGWDGTRV